MSTGDYPFGVAPKDAFDVGRCPACRADVGPRLNYCRSCFASYDLDVAKVELLSEPGVRIARSVQPALVLLGILVWALALLGTLPPVLVASAGALLVGYGLASWGLFARQPAVFSALSAVIFFGLALVVGFGGALVQVALPGPRQSEIWVFGALALAFVVLGVLSAGGVRKGLDTRRLHRVNRPVEPASEGYR